MKADEWFLVIAGYVTALLGAATLALSIVAFAHGDWLRGVGTVICGPIVVGLGLWLAVEHTYTRKRILGHIRKAINDARKECFAGSSYYAESRWLLQVPYVNALRASPYWSLYYRAYSRTVEKLRLQGAYRDSRLWDGVTAHLNADGRIVTERKPWDEDAYQAHIASLAARADTPTNGDTTNE